MKKEEQQKRSVACEFCDHMGFGPMCPSFRCPRSRGVQAQFIRGGRQITARLRFGPSRVREGNEIYLAGRALEMLLCLGQSANVWVLSQSWLGDIRGLRRRH